MGRAVVSRADPLPADATRRGRARGRRATRATPGRCSRGRCSTSRGRSRAACCAPASVRAFNALRWRASPRRERGRPLRARAVLLPARRLGDWNRLYGRGGLVQYQFVVPDGQEAALSAASS